MDLFEAIENRHSYRGTFTDKKVPREDLKKIVEAGIRAPSGCNAQTSSFVIVDDPQTLAAIAAIVERSFVSSAKAMIVCLAEHRAVYHDMSFAVEDCAASVENMLLAITALGYATVWYDGALRTDGKAKKIGELLGIPKDAEVRVILPVGEPKEKCAQRDRKSFSERAWFNHHGKNE